MDLLLAAAVAVAVWTTATATPEVFAPGVISSSAHESAPAFTPDGATVYFGRSTAQASFILVSHRSAGGWSTPRIAPFSGRWLDMEPAMAPDGSYLVFVSNRPAAAGGVPLDGSIDGVARPAQGANLWRVDRSGDGWGTPVRLADVVNTSTSTYAPSVAGNGDLYFMKADGAQSRFRLFRARRSGSGYAPPVPLPFSDGRYTDVDPAVAPDQSFIVFGSSRHPKTDIDLFIAFRDGDGWSEPVHLGDRVNSPGSDAEPRLAPDGHTLYFSSERYATVPRPTTDAEADRVLDDMGWNNGLYNIWFVDLAPWLDARPRPAGG